MILVKDVMTEPVVSATLRETLREALSLMRTNKVRYLPIINHNTNKLAGMLSERELRGLASFTEWFSLGREAYDAFLNRSIADAMPRRFFREDGLITARPNTPVSEIITLLIENKLSTVPIVADDDPNKLVGIVSYIDILGATQALFDTNDIGA